MKSANATITGAKASDADNLAGRVASFLVQVRKGAETITKTVKITD